MSLGSKLPDRPTFVQDWLIHKMHSFNLLSFPTEELNNLSNWIVDSGKLHGTIKYYSFFPRLLKFRENEDVNHSKPHWLLFKFAVALSHAPCCLLLASIHSLHQNINFFKQFRHQYTSYGLVVAQHTFAGFSSQSILALWLQKCGHPQTKVE